MPKYASDLLLYLITNPHGHFSGVYYLPLANVPVESKLSNDEIEKAMSVLSEDIELKQADTDRVSGIEELQKQQNQKLDRVSVFGTNEKQHFFIRYDSSRSIVFVKSMLRHQTGGRMSEKQVRSVLSHITQFSKSSVIVSFLDYHLEYLRYCFLKFEKLAAGADEKKLAAGVNRRKNLKAEVEIFYQQHGLSFFCSKKYPIQPSRHEEEEAKEKASEEETEDIVSESENSDTPFSPSYGKEKTPTNKRVSYAVDYALAIDDIKLGFNGLLSTVEAYIVMVANKNKTKTLARSREYGILPGVVRDPQG